MRIRRSMRLGYAGTPVLIPRLVLRRPSAAAFGLTRPACCAAGRSVDQTLEVAWGDMTQAPRRAPRGRFVDRVRPRGFDRNPAVGPQMASSSNAARTARRAGAVRST